jgi:5'-3' exonuclease
MGVPSFYRYLTQLWPRIAIDARGDEKLSINGIYTPTDLSQPNPNGIEFDNLYLDMNGIIHPCSQPDSMGVSPTEDEIFDKIFDYIDRIFAFVRPRKVLYLAIDGVAPRAKMNQQRQRRFRAAKEVQEHELIEKELFSIFVKSGKGHLIPQSIVDLQQQSASSFTNTTTTSSNNENQQEFNHKNEQHEDEEKKSPQPLIPKFDKNTITPGTPFMDRLSLALRYYISLRLEQNPGWKDLIVVLSDSSVPGEGEHKVLNFIRNQRSLPLYNPSTIHCLYGMDADLIMLALASHERHFYIIREIVFARNDMRCSICQRGGHHAGECNGLSANITQQSLSLKSYLNQQQIAALKTVNHHEPAKIMLHDTPLQPFQFLSLEILRMYLNEELKFNSQLYDLDNAIDDWVFLCFFVGNDFLPHLASFSIRENAIGVMQKLWKSLMISKIKSFEVKLITQFFDPKDKCTLLPTSPQRQAVDPLTLSTLDLAYRMKEDDLSKLRSQIYLTTNGEVNLPQLYDFIQKLQSIETAIFRSKRNSKLTSVFSQAGALLRKAKEEDEERLREQELRRLKKTEQNKEMDINFNKKSVSSMTAIPKRKEPTIGFDGDSDDENTNFAKKQQLSTNSTTNSSPEQIINPLALNHYHTLTNSLPYTVLELAEKAILNVKEGKDPFDIDPTNQTNPNSNTTQLDQSGEVVTTGALKTRVDAEDLFEDKLKKKKLLSNEEIYQIIEINPYIAWTTARNIIIDQLQAVPDSFDQIDPGSKNYVNRFYEKHFKIENASQLSSTGNLKEKDGSIRIMSPAVHDLNHIHLSYLTGLRWVFHYYYRGCSSWTWHYPYHHPPLLSELAKVPLELYYQDQSSPLNITSDSESLSTLIPQRQSHTIVTTSLYSYEGPVLPFEQLLSGMFQA